MAAVAQNSVQRSSPEADQGPKLEEEVRDLVKMLPKLNPSAEEFVPSMYRKPNGVLSADAPMFVAISDQNGGFKRDSGPANGFQRRRNNYGQGKRRVSEKVRKAQREDRIRRTVYVSEIDQNVTEEELAGVFTQYGHVEDCRACGDPHSSLRFAFIEFSDEQSARAALNLNDQMLGYYPLKVLPSKTAILPVNPTFLPQSEFEKELCTRTVYCTNIDKKVTQADVKRFFESTCGVVSRLRLLGDHMHSTRIAFVEFYVSECALNALGCSGAVLGGLPIRVSPSKTPVRPRVSRGTSQ